MAVGIDVCSIFGLPNYYKGGSVRQVLSFEEWYHQQWLLASAELTSSVRCILALMIALVRRPKD